MDTIPASTMNISAAAHQQTQSSAAKGAEAGSGDSFMETASAALEALGGAGVQAPSQKPPPLDVKPRSEAYGFDTITLPSKQGNIITVGKEVTKDAALLHITRKDGSELSLDVRGNFRITEYENGSMEVYSSADNTSYLFDATGKLLSQDGSASGQEGILSGTDGDDILINTSAKTVEGGAGDDTIVNLRANTTISGGDGDDTVFIPQGGMSLTIDGGEGNDTIIGQDFKDCTLTTGNGNDRVEGRFFSNSTIAMGAGDNTLLASSVTKGEVQMGDGNNYIGFDRAKLGGFNGTKFISTSVTMGNGNNTVQFYNISDSQIHTGNGNTTLTAGYSVTYRTMSEEFLERIHNFHPSISDSTVTMGNGNNTIHAFSLYNAKLNFGNGNNSILSDFIQNSALEFGDGNNILGATAVNTSSIHMGDGDNTLAGLQDAWLASMERAAEYNLLQQQMNVANTTEPA